MLYATVYNVRVVCVNRYEHEPTCHNQPCGELPGVGVPVILVLASKFRPPKKQSCVGGEKRRVGEAGTRAGNIMYE